MFRYAYRVDTLVTSANPRDLERGKNCLRATPGLLLVITGHYQWSMSDWMPWFSKAPNLQMQAAQVWFWVRYLKFPEIVIYRSQVQKTLDLSMSQQYAGYSTDLYHFVISCSHERFFMSQAGPSSPERSGQDQSFRCKYHMWIHNNLYDINSTS